MRAAQTDANVEPWIDGGRPRAGRTDRRVHRSWSTPPLRMCRDLQIRPSIPIIDSGVEPDVTGNAAQVAAPHRHAPCNRRLGERAVGADAPFDRTGRWCAEIEPPRCHAVRNRPVQDADVRTALVIVVAERRRGPPAPERTIPPRTDESLCGRGLQQPRERVLLDPDAHPIPAHQREALQSTASSQIPGEPGGPIPAFGWRIERARAAVDGEEDAGEGSIERAAHGEPVASGCGDGGGRTRESNRRDRLSCLGPLGPAQIQDAAERVPVASGETACTEAEPRNEQRVDGAPKSAGRCLMPVGMGDYGVIERHQHFADVAAAHEQTGGFVRRADTRQGLKRSEDVGLRAGGPVDLDGFEQERTRDRLLGWRGRDGDLIAHAANRQHDVESHAAARLEDGFVRVEPG